MILSDVFSIAEHPEQLSWERFRPGIEIHRLYGDGQRGPAAALLKYEPGATVPDHDHSGYEHILVLSGAQQDHQGKHSAGTLVINPPNTSHAVASDEGCIVLIIWEKPVVIKGEV
ncbi:MAG: cupin domain-containing protein [Cyanobacteria bacterium P01_D01_bin.156]